ncbi:MAG: regulatory protein RecX [Coleofasciculus sp. G1-WW12-02]|uniref:regulatory protein RecX n=1 Tax=Coleofasciculus sp. G1-WW12-02 TaxID=3068483 RepID=UPI0032F31B5E
MTCIDYLCKLLVRRDYSVFELTKKAQEKGFDVTDITESIEKLQRLNYQSDTRFVESMITSYRGKYGKVVIKRKCRDKGIDSEFFEQIWQSQTEDEEPGKLDSLKAKVMRKYKITDFHKIDPKTKAKVWNYLQYRGFNPGEILAQWQSEQDEAIE